MDPIEFKEELTQFKDYSVVKQIGIGAQGTVYQAIDKANKYFALKVSNPCFNDSQKAIISNSIQSEYDLMKQCNSPYIVKVHDFFFDEPSQSFVMVMDYIKGKNLLQLLPTHKQEYFTEDRMVKITQQLAKGLNHLHNLNIIHRDIKLENIMVAEDGTLKITDFGIARQTILTKLTRTTSIRSYTYDYSAPEQRNGGNVSKATDLYSLGIVLYILAYDRSYSLIDFQPNGLEYFAIQNQNDFDKFMELNFERLNINLNTIHFKLIKGLLQFNPNDRITLKEVLSQTCAIVGLYDYFHSISLNQLQVKMDIMKDVVLSKINTVGISSENLIDPTTPFPDFIQALIQFIARCPSLNGLEFHLVDYQYTYEPFKFFCEKFQNTNSITSLALNFEQNDISVQGIQSICNCLTEFQYLKKLSLNLWGNEITSEGAYSLSKALQKLVKLEHLEIDLYKNYINNQGVQYICREIQKLVNITSLSLSFQANKLTQNGAFHVGQVLEKLTNIRSLYLSLADNNLKDEGCQEINNKLSSLNNLTDLTLILFNNEISKKGAKDLASQLKELALTLKSLHLELQYNDLWLEGCGGLIAQLNNLINLEKLHLELYQNKNNSIVLAKILGDKLLQLTKLQSLYLDIFDEGMKPQGAKDFSQSLSKLKNIAYLHLELANNSIGQQGAKYLMNSFEKMANLKKIHLNLCNNNLSEENLRQLYETLSKLKKLESIHINFMKNGSILHSKNSDEQLPLIKLPHLKSLHLAFFQVFAFQGNEKQVLNEFLKFPNLKCLHLNFSILFLPPLQECLVQLQQELQKRDGKFRICNCG